MTQLREPLSNVVSIFIKSPSKIPPPRRLSPKIKRRGTSSFDTQYERIRQLFNKAHFGEIPDSVLIHTDITKSLVDLAFTCAKRGGAQTAFNKVFQVALFQALEQNAQEPLLMYMKKMEVEQILSKKLENLLDQQIIDSVRSGNTNSMAELATTEAMKVQKLISVLDPAIISSTMSNTSGK